VIQTAHGGVADGDSSRLPQSSDKTLSALRRIDTPYPRTGVSEFRVDEYATSALVRTSVDLVRQRDASSC